MSSSAVAHLPPSPRVAGGLLLTVAVGLTACTDDSPTTPGAVDNPAGSPNAANLAADAEANTDEVCRVVDFNDERETGDIVTEIEVEDFFTLAVDVDPFALPDGTANDNDNARIFSTDESPDDWAASDLVWQDGEEIDARCPDCENLGNLLVIEHEEGWGTPITPHEGPPDRPAVDATHGGDVTFSGVDAGEGDFLLRSVTFVDNDEDEAPFQVWVDDDVVGEVTDFGDGEVHEVDTGDHPLADAFTLRLGRPLDVRDPDDLTGSGGIANFELCREVEEVVGEQACTPGFWRNHSAEAPGNQEDHWPPTGHAVDDALGDVFDFDGTASEVADLADDTLIEALRYGGGPGLEGGAMILLRAAVAALLNASHDDMDFFLTESQVIEQVSEALQSNDRQTMLALAEELDELNNAGDCPF